MIRRFSEAKLQILWYFGQHNFLTHNQRQATLVVPKLTWVNYGYIHDMHINKYIYMLRYKLINYGYSMAELLNRSHC